MENKSLTHVCKVELPIPYSFYPEIQKESTVWKVESRCEVSA